MFQKWIQKLPVPRTRIQKWTQKGAAAVVSVPVQLFLFRKRAREVGCQPPGLVIVRCLRLGGDPFVEAIFGSICSLEAAYLEEMCSPNGLNMKCDGH